MWEKVLMVERDIRLNQNGNPGQGGWLKRRKMQSTILGTEWCNKYHDEIHQQRLIRHQSNWHQNRNRVLIEQTKTEVNILFKFICTPKK